MDKNPQQKARKAMHPFLWRSAVLIMVIVAIVVFFYFGQSINGNKTDNIDTIHMQKPRQIPKMKAVEPAEPLQIETAEHLDHISQAILYSRLSYFQLLTQQDPKAALSWLSLARQQVQQSKIDNSDEALEAISLLKEKIRKLPSPELAEIQQQLDTLQQDIDQLSQHKKTTTDLSEPTEQVAEKKSNSSIFTNFNSWLASMISWIKTSISIETLNTSEYQTLKRTLPNGDFKLITTQLISQAQLAANYQDTRTFQYMLKKIDNLVTFYVPEAKRQQQLRQQIEKLQQQPVSLTPPCYQELLSQLGQHIIPIKTTEQTLPESSASNVDDPKTQPAAQKAPDSDSTPVIQTMTVNETAT